MITALQVGLVLAACALASRNFSAGLAGARLVRRAVVIGDFREVVRWSQRERWRQWARPAAALACLGAVVALAIAGRS